RARVDPSPRWGFIARACSCRIAICGDHAQLEVYDHVEPSLPFGSPDDPHRLKPRILYFIVGSFSQRPPRASAELEFCRPACRIPYREDLEPSIIVALDHVKPVIEIVPQLYLVGLSSKRVAELPS